MTTIEFWKHKCKVMQLQIDWLDELANYERETGYQLNGIDEEKWKEEVDELYLKHIREEKKFNEIYNN